VHTEPHAYPPGEFPEPATTAPVEGGTRADAAYRALKTAVLRGEFALNVRLVESRLATMLDVSRTPVREALRRLSGEGLVEEHPDGGFRPCVPDTVVMRELYEVRAALELQAIGRPSRFGERHDHTALLQLRDRWRSLAATPPTEADPDFVLLDESFHEGLALAAGNRVAAELLHQVNQRIRLIRMQDFLTAERISATIDEHLAIVELVLDGDLVAAEAAFSAHLSASMTVVEQRALDALSRMARGAR
jgi:DNA-binding GntR family transcriptional regulator